MKKNVLVLGAAALIAGLPIAAATTGMTRRPQRRPRRSNPPGQGRPPATLREVWSPPQPRRLQLHRLLLRYRYRAPVLMTTTTETVTTVTTTTVTRTTAMMTTNSGGKDTQVHPVPVA